MLPVARFSDQGIGWSETFATIPSGDCELVGVLVEPEMIQHRGALLFCGSLLDQRKNLYRDIVKTARALAKEGFVVLRFDYGGFGESGGEGWKVNLSSLIDDAEACHRWLCEERPGLSTACVGIGLGAIIAAHMVSRVGPTSLIGCQPLWSVSTNNERPQWVSLEPGFMVTNHAGYCINREFYEQIVSNDRSASTPYTTVIDRRALVLHLPDGAPARAAELYRTRLKAANFSVSMTTLDAKKFWLSAELEMPIDQIVRNISDWLTEHE